MPDLSGVAIVGAGSFNPAIIHPRWLAEKQLIPDNLAEHAMSSASQTPMFVTQQAAVFVADWLHVQVTQPQAVFSTVELGREMDLRDFVLGIFDLLPETPVTAIGINSDTHFRLASEEQWHAFGDRFLPKNFWEPLFAGEGWMRRPNGQSVGTRVMAVEVARAEASHGWVRVEVAPSVRVTPNGIYIGINSHFPITSTTNSGTNANDAARTIREQWEATRTLEDQLVESIVKTI